MIYDHLGKKYAELFGEVFYLYVYLNLVFFLNCAIYPSISLLILILVVPLFDVKGVLKSITTIGILKIFSFSPMSFYFMSFEAQLFGAYVFKISMFY